MLAASIYFAQARFEFEVIPDKEQTGKGTFWGELKKRKALIRKLKPEQGLWDKLYSAGTYFLVRATMAF